MKWTVPYRPWRGTFLPLVAVEVEGIGVLDAIVDSGASCSLFSARVADELGLVLESGESKRFGGVGGSILAYRHDLPVRVMGQVMTLKVFFSREFHPSVNLLGRDNFFMHFLVTFDEVGRRTILETREGAPDSVSRSPRNG